MIGCVQFVTKESKIKSGHIIHNYRAFEGDWRYIIRCEDGKDYRCIKNADGKFVEFSA